MGSDAEVFTFDAAQYTNVVVPTLHDFLEGGSAAPWLQRLLSKAEWEYDLAAISSLRFRFASVCTYLTPEFASVVPDSDWYSDWSERSCKSTECPASNVCPLHSQLQAAAYADFNALHESAVVDQCLGQHQFVGRSMSPLDYEGVLANQGISHDHIIWRLLLLMQYRGFVVGYQGSNSDGIHGWLTNLETAQLARELAALRLPEFPRSFKAMKTFQSPGHGYLAPPPFTFEHLSLAFVGAVASIAADAGQGILWGNDVYLPDL